MIRNKNVVSTTVIDYLSEVNRNPISFKPDPRVAKQWEIDYRIERRYQKNIEDWEPLEEHPTLEGFFLVEQDILHDAGDYYTNVRRLYTQIPSSWKSATTKNFTHAWSLSTRRGVANIGARIPPGATTNQFTLSQAQMSFATGTSGNFVVKPGGGFPEYLYADGTRSKGLWLTNPTGSPIQKIAWTISEGQKFSLESPITANVQVRYDYFMVDNDSDIPVFNENDDYVAGLVVVEASTADEVYPGIYERITTVANASMVRKEYYGGEGG